MGKPWQFGVAVCSILAATAIYLALNRTTVETIRVNYFARGAWAVGNVKTCRRGANQDGTDAHLECDWILVDEEKAKVNETIEEARTAYQSRSSSGMSQTLAQIEWSKNEMARFSKKLESAEPYRVEYSTLTPKYESWLCKKMGDHELVCRG
jgi:hypothetical protein